MDKKTTRAVARKPSETALATQFKNKKIERDKEAAVWEHVRRHRKALGLSILETNRLAESKIRKERELGEILRKLEKHRGGRPSESPNQSLAVLPTLADLGMNYKYAARYQRESKVGDEKFEAWIAQHNASEQDLTSDGLLALYKKLNPVQNEPAGAPTTATVLQLSHSDFLENLEPESVDLLLTDPPYMTDVDDIESFARWILQVRPALKPTARAYVCTGAYPREIAAYVAACGELTGFTLANILVWTYRNTLGPSPTHDYKLNWQAIFYLRGPEAPPLNCPIMLEQFTVQDISAPDGRHGNRFYQWQKPDELAERFIRHSSSQGDLIIDPFAGSGTFLLAAARLGRRAVGCDTDADAIAICKKRGCQVEEGS